MAEIAKLQGEGKDIRPGKEMLSVITWGARYNEGDPRGTGKPMTGNMSGFWSYRVGKYRMLAQFEGDMVILTNVALRKEAYPYHHC